jgi:hypothetical protein
MLEIIIKHWNIETMHNILDGTFDEDSSRIRRGNASQILSAMLKLAFNIVRPLANKWPDESTESIVNLIKTSMPLQACHYKHAIFVCNLQGKT